MCFNSLSPHRIQSRKTGLNLYHCAIKLWIWYSLAILRSQERIGIFIKHKENCGWFEEICQFGRFFETFNSPRVLMLFLPIEISQEKLVWIFIIALLNSGFDIIWQSFDSGEDRYIYKTQGELWVIRRNLTIWEVLWNI